MITQSWIHLKYLLIIILTVLNMQQTFFPKVERLSFDMGRETNLAYVLFRIEVHTNIIGVDPQVGAIAISITKDKEANDCYRALIRTPDVHNAVRTCWFFL